MIETTKVFKISYFVVSLSAGPNVGSIVNEYKVIYKINDIYVIQFEFRTR